MATVFKRDRSPFFFASFWVKDEKGKPKQIKRSTRERTHKEAMKKAHEIEKQFNNSIGAEDEQSKKILAKMQEATDLALSGKLNKDIAQRLLSDILEASTGETVKAYTIEEWAEIWLKGKEGNEISSYKTYKGHLKCFLDYLGERTSDNLHTITRADILGFQEEMKEELGNAGKTANYKVKTVRSLLRQAVHDRLITFNPADGVKALSTEDSKNRIPFTRSEARNLINNATAHNWGNIPAIEWQGVILIGAYTGLRLSDIANMRWHNVHLDKGEIQITPSKTKKPMTLEIHKELDDYLLGLPSNDKPNTPLFPSLCSKRSGGNDGLSYRFGLYMDELGIDRRPLIMVDRGKELVEVEQIKSFHSFRHTLNSTLANNNVNQEIRMGITGHSDERVNNIYTHHDKQVRREAINLVEY